MSYNRGRLIYCKISAGIFNAHCFHTVTLTALATAHQEGMRDTSSCSSFRFTGTCICVQTKLSDQNSTNNSHYAERSHHHHKHTQITLYVSPCTHVQIEAKDTKEVSVTTYTIVNISVTRSSKYSYQTFQCFNLVSCVFGYHLDNS